MKPISNVQFGTLGAMAAASYGRREREKNPDYICLTHDLYKCIKQSWNDENSKLNQVKKLFIQA